MYQNVSNTMKTLRKVSFRSTTSFLPIMPGDVVLHFSCILIFCYSKHTEGCLLTRFSTSIDGVSLKNVGSS